MYLHLHVRIAEGNVAGFNARWNQFVRNDEPPTDLLPRYSNYACKLTKLELGDVSLRFSTEHAAVGHWWDSVPANKYVTLNTYLTLRFLQLVEARDKWRRENFKAQLSDCFQVHSSLLQQLDARSFFRRMIFPFLLNGRLIFADAW